MFETSLAFALGIAASVPASAKDLDPPQLLVVGSPHFGNPARDIGNIAVDDVLSPARQRQIEAVVERLAVFHPTRVAVEWRVGRQPELDQRYAEYRAGRYKLSSDERDQIGLRLAARLGLAQVDAVDWNEEPPGKDEDYDFPAWANAHGRGEDWRTLQDKIQARADTEGRLMRCTPISAWLRRLNAPAYRRSDQRIYYDIARLGDQLANPGATWVGSWYSRNLRILNNLTQIAAPSARIVVIYGAGHGFLLDQQAREAGVFRVVDTQQFLPTSTRDSWTQCPG